MTGDERDLVTSEGVDEGSSASGTEAASDEKASDVFGMRAAGTPDNGEQQAAPELVVTGQEEPPQPGQQQQVGER
ncbi:MAG: hypothetical protein QOE84_3035 [Actinomycetota bacterium]|jgi:hypothetical protein|nr:hypothetical protein [Actinomycetota bacterium]